jgi:hypothetical protein
MLLRRLHVIGDTMEDLREVRPRVPNAEFCVRGAPGDVRRADISL